MHTKIQFATEEQSNNFYQSLSELFTYLNKSKTNRKHAKTIQTLVNDNVKLFNRVQELENERKQISK